jgi:hypothetical protein
LTEQSQDGQNVVVKDFCLGVTYTCVSQHKPLLVTKSAYEFMLLSEWFKETDVADVVAISDHAVLTP